MPPRNKVETPIPFKEEVIEMEKVAEPIAMPQQRQIPSDIKEVMDTPRPKLKLFELNVRSEMDKIGFDDEQAKQFFSSIKQMMDLRNWEFPHPYLAKIGTKTDIDTCMEVINERIEAGDYKFASCYLQSLLQAIIINFNVKIQKEFNIAYAKIVSNIDSYINVANYAQEKYDEVKEMVMKNEEDIQKLKEQIKTYNEELSKLDRFKQAPAKIIYFNNERFKRAMEHNEDIVKEIANNNELPQEMVTKLVEINMQILDLMKKNYESAIEDCKKNEAELWKDFQAGVNSEKI